MCLALVCSSWQSENWTLDLTWSPHWQNVRALLRLQVNLTNISIQTLAVNLDVLFQSTGSGSLSYSDPIRCLLDLIKPSGIYPAVSHSEVRLHCTKRAFELSAGLLALKSAVLRFLPCFHRRSGEGGGYLSAGKNSVMNSQRRLSLLQWEKKETKNKSQRKGKNKVLVNPQYQLIPMTGRETWLSEVSLGG